MEDQNNLTTIPYRKCNFVLSISPNLDLINDFKKHVKNETFYMPIWKKSELEAIARLYPLAIRCIIFYCKRCPSIYLKDLKDDPGDHFESATNSHTLDE